MNCELNVKQDQTKKIGLKLEQSYFSQYKNKDKNYTFLYINYQISLYHVKEWSHPPALTCNSIFLCGHSMCIQLLELPVELLQFSAGGSKLTVHISSILAVGHRSSQPLSRLFDLQFPLNLLPEKGDRILYTLLELRVHEVTFSQTPQTAALLCSSNIEKVKKSTCIKLLFAYSSLFD